MLVYMKLHLFNSINLSTTDSIAMLHYVAVYSNQASCLQIKHNVDDYIPNLLNNCFLTCILLTRIDVNLSAPTSEAPIITNLGTLSKTMLQYFSCSQRQLGSLLIPLVTPGLGFPTPTSITQLSSLLSLSWFEKHITMQV